MNAENPNQKKTVSLLGQPEKAPGDNRVYVIKQRAKVGQLYKMVCPECGFSMVKKVVKEGRQRWDCPQCKAIVGFAAVANAPKSAANSQDIPQTGKPQAEKAQVEKDNQEKAKLNREKQEKEEAPRKPTTKLDKSAQQGLGELVLGSFFSRKHFALRPGSIWIGRKDQQEPSELQLNDGYASSRSVLLDVIPSDKGCLFKLTVKHATNPLYVNSSEIAVNNSVYVNFDDVIIMGKTKLTFKKQKKS